MQVLCVLLCGLYSVLRVPALLMCAAGRLQKGEYLWLQWDSPGIDGHNEWFSAEVNLTDH